MKSTFALLSLLTFLTFATAQEGQHTRPAGTVQPAAKVQEQKFVLEPGTIKLTDLIDRSARFLGWNILAQEQELASSGGQSSVQLQNQISVDHDGCLELVTSLLYRSGLALVPLDEGKNLYEVISLMGPRQRDISARAKATTVADILARPNLKIMVTTVVPLQHTNATIATNALRPFFASTGGPSGGSLTLGNVGNNTSLLLSGMQDQVAAALRLIQACDVAPPADQLPPSLADRVEALERRIAELERKLAKPQDR